LQGNDFNETVSTKTASYTLVAADAGTKVVMNSASATTITVDTSLFSAGDTLTILNIGAGTCTVTAGTATVSTTGSLALAQNGGGTLYFTSPGVSVFQADGVAATASGLVLVATATPTAVASVSINNCFTSTYAAYLIESIITTGVGANAVLGIRLRASATDTTTNYVSQRTENYGTTVGTGLNVQGTDEWPFGIIDPTGKSVFGEITLQNPNVADQTTMATRNNGRQADLTYIMSSAGGVQTASTQFDGITFFTTGTSFTGTIRVYGIANS